VRVKYAVTRHLYSVNKAQRGPPKGCYMLSRAERNKPAILKKREKDAWLVEAEHA